MRFKIKRLAKREKGYFIRQSPYPRWAAPIAAILVVAAVIWSVYELIYGHNPGRAR